MIFLFCITQFTEKRYVSKCRPQWKVIHIIHSNCFLKCNIAPSGVSFMSIGYVNCFLLSSSIQLKGRLLHYCESIVWNHYTCLHSSIMGHITHPLMLYALIFVKLLCRFWDAGIYRIKIVQNIYRIILLSKIKQQQQQQTNKQWKTEDISLYSGPQICLHGPKV